MATSADNSGPVAVINPFAGVDFSQLERSLQRPRTLMNFALNVIVAGMTLLALIPLFSVLWMPRTRLRAPFAFKSPCSARRRQGDRPRPYARRPVAADHCSGAERKRHSKTR